MLLKGSAKRSNQISSAERVITRSLLRSPPVVTASGQHSLQYSSGNGNDPFGLGWQLSIPRITRKTEKGLPQYDDTDVFVMSGAEDLVPCLKKVVDPTSGQETWISEDPVNHPFHTVYRYRPRTEGPLRSD